MINMVHRRVQYLERLCEEVLKQMVESSFLKKPVGTHLLSK
jgi:hypothetical protein